MVLQAGIQTSVWEGCLLGETQLRSNEALMLVGRFGKVLSQKAFENMNWETCGPCETQQNLYLPKSQAWNCEFSMVFQAGIQTKIREGGLSGKIQLRSYEGLMEVAEGL